MGLRQLVPTSLKRAYWRWGSGELWADLRDRVRAKKIDLRRTLIADDNYKLDRPWTEVTKDMQIASVPLAESPHVRFLEQYRALGETLFLSRNFEQSPYYRNAMVFRGIVGHHLGERTPERTLAEARAFVDLYERIRKGDPAEVQFPSTSEGHSPLGALPTVRLTLTPNTFQIQDGHHRLAIYWVLGHRKARVIVLPPAPTALQSFVLSAAQTQGRRELCQPIDSAEFDGSWTLIQSCRDRLAMMLKFLTRDGNELKSLSVVNLGCRYGWFVVEFSKRGCHAIGVEPDPVALKIGRIVYDLRAEQLIQSDLLSFVTHCNRSFDVVLLSGGLYDLARKAPSRGLEELFERVDSITSHCLFLDTAQTYEPWWGASFPGWNEDAIESFVRQRTSLDHVVRLRPEPSDARNDHTPSGGTLLACIR